MAKMQKNEATRAVSYNSGTPEIKRRTSFYRSYSGLPAGFVIFGGITAAAAFGFDR